nr:MAG: hypothetical protein [Enquatrovirus sp.]
MGGVGRAIKKFVNKVVKVWKKLNPITFKILKKLGLRGKHVTHTYLMVQPLNSGYQHDPVKTYLAEAIAAGADIPTHLEQSLKQGAGINLMQYYYFQKIRIKKYNMKTIVSNIEPVESVSTAELESLVDKYLPRYKDFPTYVVSNSPYPDAIGSYWTYMLTHKTNMDNIHMQFAPDNPLNPKKHIGNYQDPHMSTIRLNNQNIDCLTIGTIDWLQTDTDGNEVVKSYPVYIGSKDFGKFTAHDKLFYFYDPLVQSYLEKEFAYMVVVVPNIVDKSIKLQNDEEYLGLEPDGTISTTYNTISNNPDELQYEEVVEEYITIDLIRYKRTTVYTCKADGNSLDNLEIIYGNQNETNATGFYEDISATVSENKELTEEEKNNKLNEIYKFYPALPLKRRSKHTIKFKHGDPYKGVYDPAQDKSDTQKKIAKLRKPSSGMFRPKTLEQIVADNKKADSLQKKVDKLSTSEDSEVKRTPRTRNKQPSGYTKPRTIQRRLRKKIKNDITSPELRKFIVAAKLLGQEYEALVGQLIHSEKAKNDSPEVHHSYILPSVTLNTKVMECKKYWFDFMDRTYDKLHGNKPSEIKGKLKSSSGEDGTSVTEPLIQNSAAEWLNTQIAKGVIDISTKGTYTIETDLDIDYSFLFTPNNISITAATENNKVDPLVFGLSYVHMNKFKIKGTIRNKKKRRLRNYYEIKMGRNNDNKSPPIKAPVSITYTVKRSRGSTRSIYEEDSNIVIDNIKLTGSISVVTPSENGFSFTTQHKEVETMRLVKSKNNPLMFVPTNYEDTFEDPNVTTYTCFCKQVGKDEIEVIAVMGMSMFSLVHDKGVSMSAQDFMLNYEEMKNQGFYNMFTMPICYKTLRRAGLVNNTRFASRSVQRLDYSTKDQYIPWYARSAFKVVLTIVQIVLFVITAWSGGWGSALVQAAKQGIMAVIKQILTRIAMQIAIQLAVKAVVKALTKLFGVQFAAILGALATVALTAYGVGQNFDLSLPYATQVFMAAPAIINASLSQISNMQANLQEMMEKEKVALEKATKDLEEGKEYFEAYINSGIDPQAFVSALQTRVEKMDEFITRTLETNMNQFADLDFLSGSLDAQLVIDYAPNLESNWSGVPTKSSVSADQEENPNQILA